MKLTQSENNLTWHHPHITVEERQQFYRQKPATFWLTGLSGAGKSTLAFALERRLVELGHACYVLDGDNVRHNLNRDLGFAAEDRHENIRRIAEVARLFNDAGIIVITSFISPYRADRDVARQIIGSDRFMETWLCTELATCEDRDPKGIYAKARTGAIQNFTGISAPYEVPLAPELTIDTGKFDLESCIEQVLSRLSNLIIPKAS